jgi:CRISPR-associated protein Csm2
MAKKTEENTSLMSEKGIRDYFNDGVPSINSQIALIEQLLTFQSSDHVVLLMNWIEAFVKKDCDVITTNQLWNIYKKILDISQDLDREEDSNLNVQIQLLRPKLAYIAARQTKAKELVKFFNEILKKLGEQKENQVKRFENFKYFFEAVVAYHKFYDSKKEINK